MTSPDLPDDVPNELASAVAAAVSVFGRAVAPRLSSGVGEPEDQMRGPLEALLSSAADAIGVTFTVVGEASLADLKVRPDYAAFVNGAITGYIEVKSPGKGADPNRWGARSHDRKQWEKLKKLPNVLYTDGESWGLYRTGERVGPVVRLTGDITDSSSGLHTDGDGLARLLSAFLHWAPTPPRTMAALVHTIAPLTRLLRDEVFDTLRREHVDGGGPFTELARDWRALLFPGATDFEFADGYAQSVTFALLLARAENVDFDDKSVDQVARLLGRSHALLGKALAVLTDETIGALAVTLDTLVRVVSVIDFSRFATHVANPYLALYEHFLAEYDPELRKETGSYYTPAPVVEAMTRLTDDILRTRLTKQHGLASDGVVVVDPAMGTGTYVLAVLETAADTVREAEGPGAVPARLTGTASRLIGIEKQTGPFAVAEMRVAEALRRHGADAPASGVRLYVADTLDDPYAEETRLAATMEPIAVSRRRANKMKREEPVLVVIGNPPYRERAAGHGGFIEHGAPGTSRWSRPPLDAFREPGNGRQEKKLSNLYVYFWRFACWKVFEAHPEASEGVVCFITPSSYLSGAGYKGMRRYLRQHASEAWIINCTPEGHQPDVATRLFGGVQQPIAIGVFLRGKDTRVHTPAQVHYRAVHGRQADKFTQLSEIGLDDGGWETCPHDWTAPFLPMAGDVWGDAPALADLVPWSTSGVMPSRTWVYAPLPQTLERRWAMLTERPPEQRATLFLERSGTTIDSARTGLPGFPHPDVPIRDAEGSPPPVSQVAYRSFDLQYVLADARLMNRPGPNLWRVRNDQGQVFLTQPSQQVFGGPAITFSAAIPDIDHYNGRGGKAAPLYAGPRQGSPNVLPGLTNLLTERVGVPVSAEDLFAYIGAVCSHPGFSSKFADELRTPSVRVPLTTETQLWSRAVSLGRRLLWLHTRGTRYVDIADNRPPGPPKTQPRPLAQVAIPGTADGFPDELSYDPETATLSIGAGRISPVAPGVVDYEVSGMNVLRKWFGYRKATRPKARGKQSPLDDVRPHTWPADYTTDLLELLNVLTEVVALEPKQAELLELIVSGPLLTVEDLIQSNVLPVPDDARHAPALRESHAAAGAHLLF